MKKSLLLAACLLLAGCSGVQKLGNIGTTKYYAVKSQSFVGPNTTIIVSENADHKRTTETTASCTGIGASAVNAAGNVGSSAVFGLSLKRNNYDNTVNTSNGNDITAAGGSATAAATGSGAVNSTSTGGTYNRINGNSANAPGRNKP